MYFNVCIVYELWFIYSNLLYLYYMVMHFNLLYTYYNIYVIVFVITYVYLS